MVIRSIVILVLCNIVWVAVALCGCLDPGRPIKANIAGQVVDSNGLGVGLIPVALIDVETGKEITRQNADARGLFFFKKLDGGNYTFKLFNVTGAEIPIESNSVELGVGRTKTITVTIL